MTTGGPDTSDIFEEEINPSNPKQYRYDGQWRDFTIRKEVINVKNGDKVEPREVTLAFSHHGPIVATQERQGLRDGHPLCQRGRPDRPVLIR